jgi:hypothetical protein
MARANTSLFTSLTLGSSRRLVRCGRQQSPWQGLRWTRNVSTGPTFTAQKVSSKPFWNSGRVLLFTIFASSLAYTFGVRDVGNHVDELWKKERTPRYGSPKDLQKVGYITSLIGSLLIHGRQLQSFEQS